MQDAAGSAKVRAHDELGHDAFRRELDDAHSHEAGKERIEDLLN